MTADGTKPTEEHRSYRRVCNGMQQCTNPAQSLPNSSMFTPCYTMFTFTILSSLKADVEMPWTSLDFGQIENFSRRFHGTQGPREPGLSGLGEPCLKTPWGSPLGFPMDCWRLEFCDFADFLFWDHIWKNQTKIPGRFEIPENILDQHLEHLEN